MIDANQLKYFMASEYQLAF